MGRIHDRTRLRAATLGGLLSGRRLDGNHRNLPPVNSNIEAPRSKMISSLARVGDRVANKRERRMEGLKILLSRPD
jgi:hypothetical protein